MSDKRIPTISSQYSFPPPSVQYTAPYPAISSARNTCVPPPTVRAAGTHARPVSQFRLSPMQRAQSPLRYQYQQPYYDYSAQNIQYQNYQTPYPPQQPDYYKEQPYQNISYDNTNTQNITYDPMYYQTYPPATNTDYTSTNYYQPPSYTEYTTPITSPAKPSTSKEIKSTVESKKERSKREDDEPRRNERTCSRSANEHRSSLSSSRYRSKRSRRSRTPPRESRKTATKTKYVAPKSNNKSERDIILEKWRKNYCATSEEVSNKLKELSDMTQDEILEREKSFWTRTTPGDLFYVRDELNPKVVKGTSRLQQICERFKEELVLRANKVNDLKEPYHPPERKKRTRLCKHKSEPCHSDSSSNDDFSEEEEENIMEELTRKQQHPDRLHPEMWYNDPGEMNDGPLCRCSLKSRKSGIRHGIYAGEQFLQLCDKDTNNANHLYHYKITISPPTNFLTKTPTIIKHDEHEFIFEGFSMFSHFPLVKLPTCKVIRFNIEYTILYIEEKHPDNFTIRELDLFNDFLFRELLELVDLDFKAAGDVEGCAQFHFMPRFVRELPDNGREILSMKEVLQYLLDSSELLLQKHQLESMVQMSQYEWQAFADEVKGMVVTYPGKKPCSVRVDQLDRNTDLQVKGQLNFPEIVHFGIRPPQLSYAGNPEYQKAWRDYVKFRHLLANMSKPTYEDKRKLEQKEAKLQEMRTQSKMKRDVTVAVSAEGFYKTGIMCDIVQHAMLIPVLVCHLRFHHSLNILEKNINYRFQNRALLQLALTHPSYRENFGTNPDHARNSLTNCGIRQPEYGDRRIHYMNTRKRGINTLINIMSRFGKKHETESNITHNERLEFLGDAVVEFLSSIHLFLMFPDLEEGGLATYRAAIVQNQHLAVLARILDLDQFMLYAHGSDLCHDLELRHAMANCFEALMGALFLDGGIEVADKVFGETFFKNEVSLLEVWVDLPKHPLQEQEPQGDRQWIPKFEVLQKLVKFEEATGIEFKHIRLLARAFTDRSIGYTNLTLGSNQRLEFLGDTVLQLIASEYLYKYFPEHHEGHLSLLRSSLVNNRTQAVVCDDLGMANYAVYNNPKAELKTKDRADLLEAYLGALYIDSDLEDCRRFCQVTLFPRLREFIVNQDWNDPKSKLQQCCLTLRTMDGGEPDIPVYKVIECKGPTNTRVYTVAVYFRNRRLAKATGHSIQQAEMNAAKQALENSQDLFPQLDHQRRVIAKSMKKQKYPQKIKNDSDNSNSGDDDDESYSKTRSKSPVNEQKKSEEKKSRKRTRTERSDSESPEVEIINSDATVSGTTDLNRDNNTSHMSGFREECTAGPSAAGRPRTLSPLSQSTAITKCQDSDLQAAGQTTSPADVQSELALPEKTTRNNTDSHDRSSKVLKRDYEVKIRSEIHRREYRSSSRLSRTRDRSRERKSTSSYRRHDRDYYRYKRSRSRTRSRTRSRSRSRRSRSKYSYARSLRSISPFKTKSVKINHTQTGEESSKCEKRDISSDKPNECSESINVKLSENTDSDHSKKQKKEKFKKEKNKTLNYLNYLNQLKEQMLDNTKSKSTEVSTELADSATQRKLSLIDELKKRALLPDDLARQSTSTVTAPLARDTGNNPPETN